MTNRKPLHLRQLLAVSYGLAIALWLAAWVWGGFVLLYYNLQGAMPHITVPAQEMSVSSMVSYTENGWTPPGAGDNWYLSTDDDPHLYWQGQGYLDNVCLQAEYFLPPGAVVLYYLTPGQTDYTESQKVYGTMTDGGVWFDVGGRYVTGLRVDTDSRGGVPTRLDGLCLNQDTAYLRRILPNAGQWVLLLAVPAAAAALAGLAAKALGYPSEENA